MKTNRRSLALLGLVLFTVFITSTFVAYSYASESKTPSENTTYEDKSETECGHHDSEQEEYMHHHRGEMHQNEGLTDEEHHHC